MLNLVWAVASGATVVAGPLALTALGSAVILTRAVAVAVFAEWQFFALCRVRRG